MLCDMCDITSHSIAKSKIKKIEIETKNKNKNKIEK